MDETDQSMEGLDESMEGNADNEIVIYVLADGEMSPILDPCNYHHHNIHISQSAVLLFINITSPNLFLTP